MFYEPGSFSPYTGLIITLIVMGVFGGFEILLTWYARAYDKTPAPIRKVAYILFLVAGFYYAIKFI